MVRVSVLDRCCDKVRLKLIERAWVTDDDRDSVPDSVRLAVICIERVFVNEVK